MKIWQRFVAFSEYMNFTSLVRENLRGLKENLKHKIQYSDTFLWHPHESLTSQEDDQERFLFMDSESIDIQGKVWHFFQGFWLLTIFCKKR